MMSFYEKTALTCQIIVTVLFMGSFIIAYINVRTFRKSNTTATLKGVMEDYRQLAREGAFSKYEEELIDWKDQLSSTELTPTNFYYNHFKHTSTIAHFYEHVGILVKYNLIDFEILFELLPFPNKFWEDTKEFQKIMQELTYIDFWIHFIYLHKRYMEAREKRQKPRKKAAILKLRHSQLSD